MRSPILATVLIAARAGEGSYQTSSSVIVAAVARTYVIEASHHEGGARSRSSDDPRRALQGGSAWPTPPSSSLFNFTTAASAAWDDRSDTATAPVAQGQCSLFEANDGAALPSPPAVFVGGFGGSSTRHVAALLDTAGVYLTARDAKSQDTLAARSSHCGLNAVEGVHARLRRRFA
jgi:hypothetical protein